MEPGGAQRRLLIMDVVCFAALVEEAVGPGKKRKKSASPSHPTKTALTEG